MFKVIDYEDGFIAYYVENKVVVNVLRCDTMDEVKKFQKTLDIK